MKLKSYQHPKPPSKLSTFSLINVFKRDGNKVSGSWLQNHTGTLETAKQKAKSTEAANGNKIDVAVIKEVNSTTPILSSPFQGIAL